jgi:hypothetical protein
MRIRSALWLASSLSCAVVVMAEPTSSPVPTGAPSTAPATRAVDWSLVPLEELEQKANTAFEAGRYDEALPLLRSYAVRIRNQDEKVQLVLEKVRLCEAMLAATASTQPVIEGQTVARVPHDPPREGQPREMTLLRLGNFDYDGNKGGNIPADVKALAGSLVRVKGYMLPLDQTDRITKFVLVPDLFACCFGQPPQIQHTVIVRTPKGKSLAYYPEPIWVTGKLNVEEKSEDGFIISIFEMEATSVKPAE